jgi:acyl carrier protein
MASLNVSDEEILERFARVVAASLRIDASQVTADTYLNDLGAESLDLLEITMDAEEEFNVLIPQKNILDVAQDVAGPGVLVHERRITDAGRRLLKRRMPEFDIDAAGEVTTADLNRQMLRVGAWVRMIRGLMEQSPRQCPECAAPFPKAVAGRVTCAACGIARDLPLGDDLNRQWVEEYFRDGAAAPAPAIVTGQVQAI